MLLDQQKAGVGYIETFEPSQLLKENRSCVEVIDVRDEINEGKIPGARSIPVDLWEDDDMIEELLTEHVSSKKAHIVFHCALSQSRGPWCAMRYCAAKSRNFEDLETPPHIKILRGGYSAWKDYVK